MTGDPGLGRTLGMHAQGRTVEQVREPTLRGYAACAALTLALTAAEMLLVFGGARTARVLLPPLMLANFGAAAAFYQGLWFDRPLHRAIFTAGLFFGLLTFSALAVLLRLGSLARP